METCGAFGSGGFGSLSFGSDSPVVTIAPTQSELNAAVVELSGVEALVDVLGPDPLDPDSWALSFGEVVNPGSVLPLVQAVERIDDTTVKVLFDAPCTAGQTYVVTYLPAVDEECDITASASFVAFAPPRAFGPTVAGRVQGRFDLANPQYEADAAGNVTKLGTLQVDSTGDLANETGIPYLRKRIIRRLTTPLGAFLSLVGYGLAIPQKRNLRLSEMLRLKVLAQQQIMEEPDVRAVSVSVSQPAPGSIILAIRVQTVAGLEDQFETTVGGAARA